MKKQRFLALALATTMLLSSVSFSTYAEEIDALPETVVEETVESDEDETVEPVADETASGAAAVTDTDTEGTLTPHAYEGEVANVGGLYSDVTEPWKATVTGDAGGQPKLDGTETYTDANGNVIPYFAVAEKEDGTVNTRMGMVQSETVTTAQNVGKIATDSDGMVMYYQELKDEDNFVFKATAKINAIDNANNQVSFGLVVKDEVQEMKNYACNTNYVAVGPKHMGKPGSQMVRSYYRNNKRLYDGVTTSSYYREDLLLNSSTAPQVGDVINMELSKRGNNYTLTYGNEDSIILTSKDIELTGDIYVGLFAVRNADITWSDISLTMLGRLPSELEIVNKPNKTQVPYSTALDTTGLEVLGTYSDGEQVMLSSSDYVITGFDSSKLGTCTVTVSTGSAETTFDVEIVPLKVSEIILNNSPVKNEYFAGTLFNSKGIEVNAVFEDGSKTLLNNTQYEITIDGKAVNNDTYMTADMVGTKNVKVSYVSTDVIDSNGVYDDYNITIKPATLTGIALKGIPTKRQYYIGDEFEQGGLIIAARFESEGKMVTEVIRDTEYTVTGFDSSKLGACTMTVAYNKDTTKTCTFKVDVIERSQTKAQIINYPRMTFAVGEAFDAKGLEMGIYYNSGDVEPMDNSQYYYYDGKIYTDKDGNKVDAATVLASDYYIDLTNYDSSKYDPTAKENTTQVIIKSAFSDIVLKVAITPEKQYIWKAALFGASSLGNLNAEIKDPSFITVTDNEGNDTLVGDGNLPIGIMQDGKLTNVNKVNLNSWNGAGKITGDQDGIAYYYTRVNPNNNFSLSADININRYIRDPQNNSVDAADVAQKKKDYQAIYDSLGINHTVTDEEALDMIRSGQESFGMMARDAIPLYSKNPQTANSNSIVTDMAYAEFDEYGEPMNIYEAWQKGLPTANDSTIALDRRNVEDVFASNIVLAGGYSGATYSTDPTASSFYKNSNYNRINIYVRKGIAAINGGGTKVGPYNTTNTVPAAGEKYNLTLKRINYGYSLTTYNYQTGETITNYSFDSEDGLDNLLTSQDRDNVFVGFYACRFADVDVSSIELYETDVATDPVITRIEDKIYSPKVTLESGLYSTNVNYSLVLKSNQPAGGLVTIKQNDKIIYSDEILPKKETAFSVTLVPDSANDFSVLYTPNKADLCTSYDEIVERFTITHKGVDSAVTEIYAGPNGSIKGDGSRSNPFDLETAIGFAKAGQTVVLLDGTYNIKEKITIPETHFGSDKNMIRVFAEEGANPVIDLRKLTAGFSIAGDYWHFKGIEICNSAGNGKAFELGGQHNIVENCTFRDNGDTGFQISRIGSSNDFDEWPAYNYVLNCESYNNCDPSKNNADGFGIKLTVGNGNMFENCISHHNLDDGWDMYTKLATGAIGKVVLEGCVTYKQGYKLNADGSEEDWNATSGGNGFKMGGENVPVMHYLKDCITFENKNRGVDSNFNPTMKMRNVVNYNNRYENVGLYSGIHDIYDYDMKGVISYGGNIADRIGSLTYDAEYPNHSETPLISENNYLIYGFNESDYPDKASFDVAIGIEEYGSKLNYDFFKAKYTDAGYTGDTKDLRSYNSKGDVLTEDNILNHLVSLDKYVSLGDNQRYSRAADGSFIKGDFLARVNEYVHMADDIPVKPIKDKEETEATTAQVTQTTTVRQNNDSSDNVGSNKGGGSSSSVASGVKTAEETTKSDTDVKETPTEATTASYFVLGNGMVITPPTGTVTDKFDDIATRPWAVSAINTLASAGIVNGVTENQFAPDAYSKRADFVVMIVNVLGIDGNATDNFNDVSSSKYYAKALAIAKAAGFATGYSDGSFSPEETITRQDMMVLVARVYEFLGCELNYDESCLSNFTDGDKVASYARKYVAALINANAVAGVNGNIEPTALITRAQMAVLVVDVYNTARKMASDYMAELDTEETTEVEEVTEETTETEEETTVSDDETEETTEAEDATETTTEAE